MDGLSTIQHHIHELRGQRVMLDFDLAQLYGVETKTLNQAVKRNIKRFEGDDFMFQLTKDEAEYVRSRSQFVTLNKGRGSNIKYLPFAFTEQGVAMLSSVLRSETAININRGIMRSFVLMRKAIDAISIPAKISELERKIENLQADMEEILTDQNEINEDTRAQLDAIATALAELQSKEPPQRPRRRIGFQ